jgi:hypothetical protein
MRGISWLAEEIWAFQEGICAVESVTSWQPLNCKGAVSYIVPQTHILSTSTKRMVGKILSLSVDFLWV